MTFSNTIIQLDKVKKFSHYNVENFIDILQNKEFLIKDFLEMINNFSIIINQIPNDSYMDMINITNVFTNDLLQLGHVNDDQDVEPEIGFPHLVIAIINLNLANKMEFFGLFGESHKALQKAKDPWVIPFDTHTKEGDIYLKRSIDLDLFLIPMASFSSDVRTFFVSRAALSFRLSKVMGNVGNEAEIIFKSYKKFTKTESPSNFDLLFYTNYLDLLDPDSEKANSIVKLLNDSYLKLSDTNHRFLIASCLAFNLRSLDWTKKAIAEDKTFYWAELIYMRILEECHAEKINHHQIIGLFLDFMERASILFPDRIMFELIKQKYSIIFTQILVSCIEKNEMELLLSIVYNWNAFKPGNLIFHDITDKNIFVTIPNFSGNDGPIFLIKCNDEIIFIPIHSVIKLEEIMELKSKVEASWYTLIGNEVPLNFQEEFVMSREQLDYSIDYINAIKKFIGLEELKEELDKLHLPTKFEYLETSWTNTPIIPILSNNTKHTFSITSGYQRNQIPENINNVLIWFDPAEDLHRAAFELSGLLKIFEKNNVNVEIVRESSCTKNGFIEKYSDPKYDLIWIISHGAFDSNNSPNSNLKISKTEFVTAWELQKHIPKMRKGRYLVLNACYSGCSDVRNNSMGFIGLAPSATNESQIVLGQLWFVDVLASGVLGILTLDSLIRGESLQSSLKKSTLTMSKGNITILEALRAIDNNLEIIERVERTSVQYEIPFYSMSGVVFD